MYYPRTQILDKSSRATNNIALLLASYEVHAQYYYVVLLSKLYHQQPEIVARGALACISVLLTVAD
jgi:hypothetical protein